MTLTRSATRKEEACQMVLKAMSLRDWINPFNATPEEFLAGMLDENGLVGPDTRINDEPASVLCRAFYQKRKRFKEATRLGSVLVQQHVLSPKQLEEALAEQAREPAPLGEVLLRLGLCSASDIDDALARQALVREDLNTLEQTELSMREAWQKLVSYMKSL